MTKEQLECICQISETFGLLSRQLGMLTNLFKADISDTATGSDKQQEAFITPTPSEIPEVESTASYSPMYFGTPSGNGFEDSSQLQSSSVKCLYVILRKSGIYARYYPLPEKLSRFKMNPTLLLTPVCTVVGEITEALSIEFTEDDFGELEYENGYWKVTKKCNVFCK